MKKIISALFVAVILSSALTFTGCTKKEKTIAGVAIGAGAGAAIGSAAGNTEGAVAGGLIGGVAGGLLGHSMGDDEK